MQKVHFLIHLRDFQVEGEAQAAQNLILLADMNEYIKDIAQKKSTIPCDVALLDDVEPDIEHILLELGLLSKAIDKLQSEVFIVV